MLSVFMLSVIMLSVIMLSVIMLSVITLSVAFALLLCCKSYAEYHNTEHWNAVYVNALCHYAGCR
jgi:hypothetical protein